MHSRLQAHRLNEVLVLRACETAFGSVFFQFMLCGLKLAGWLPAWVAWVNSQYPSWVSRQSARAGDGMLLASAPTFNEPYENGVTRGNLLIHGITMNIMSP